MPSTTTTTLPRLMIQTFSTYPNSWEAIVTKTLYRGLRTGALGSTRGVSSATRKGISRSWFTRAPTREPSILRNKTFRQNLRHYRFSKLTLPFSTWRCRSLRCMTQIKLLPSKAKSSTPPCLRRGQSPITPRTPPRFKWRNRSRHLSLKK